MAVRLKTGSYWYPLGSEGLVHSFFSTVAYHLEENRWGSKYPSIMKELYHGQLHNNIDHALRELADIKCNMRKYTPDQIVWDINDLTRRPPWEDKRVYHITTLSDNFVSMGGKDLFIIFQDAFHKANEIEAAVTIITF